jgi:drug/metabolite transporter (DMT)-like permease
LYGLARATPIVPFTVKAAVIALAINIAWGGNTVAVKFGLESVPPLWSGFIRFGLGLGCVVLWARCLKLPLIPRRSDWLPLAALSGVFTVQIVLMNVGLLGTSAGAAAVLIATHPLFAAVLAHYFIARDRLTVQRSVGLAVAFAGTAYLLLDSASGGGSWTLIGNALVLLSAVLLGVRLVLTARVVTEREPAVVIPWQMLLSLPVFLVGALIFEPLAEWKPIEWPALLGLLYQGLVVAGLGFMTLAYLLKRYAASTTVSFGFVTPVSGVGLGVLLLDEPFTLALLVGVTAVGIGLILIARSAH